MDDLWIVNQGGQRYLFNRTDEALKRVQIVDELRSYELGIVYPSPVYEVVDIPPHSYVELTDRDVSLGGAQLWRIERAEWEEKVLSEPFTTRERKRWGGAEFSETLIDRELRHIGSVPGRRIGQDLTGEFDMGEFYVQKIGIFRDIQRRLHLLNRSYVGIEKGRLACYHFQREDGRWPESKHEAALREITVREMPSRSYLTLFSGFDTNRERFEFDLLEAAFSDEETFRASDGSNGADWELPLTNRVRSAPLEKWKLTRAETGTVEGVDWKR